MCATNSNQTTKGHLSVNKSVCVRLWLIPLCFESLLLLGVANESLPGDKTDSFEELCSNKRPVFRSHDQGTGLLANQGLCCDHVMGFGVGFRG